MRSHTTRVKVDAFWRLFRGAKIPAYWMLQKKLLRFFRNAVDADVIRDYEHLKTKNEPIVYYLTRLRRPNRILFFARLSLKKKEEEKKVKMLSRWKRCRSRKDEIKKITRAVKDFCFSKENCFFSLEKLIWNRARRAHGWKKREVNLYCIDASEVGCSRFALSFFENFGKLLHPHRFLKVIFLSQTLNEFVNIAFDACAFERHKIDVCARKLSRKLLEGIVQT